MSILVRCVGGTIGAADVLELFLSQPMDEDERLLYPIPIRHGYESHLGIDADLLFDCEGNPTSNGTN